MVDFLRKNLLNLAVLCALCAYIVTPTQASFAPSVVRLRQSGTVTMTAGLGGTATATLSTTLTTLNKALLVHNGCTVDGTTDAPIYQARLALTNTTTVTATRGCGGTCPDATTVCAFSVVEYF